MSKSATSPTALLLQSSRLFSLPRPLPQPALAALTSTGVTRASETATLPYPTHQAIATPPSSQFRGDWGLKRALPAKATSRTSTPVIRVYRQDTEAHITDFGSAGDHVNTERKFREMGVPLILRPTKSERGSNYKNPRTQEPPTSAFKTTADFTEGSQNWKLSGPWLAGMQEGEFDAYATIVTTRRKKAWHTFLASHVLQERLYGPKRRAQEDGVPLSASDLARLEEQLTPTSADLAAYEKNLRDEHLTSSLSSTLTALIAQFLNLPSAHASFANPVAVQTEDLKRLTNTFRLDGDAKLQPPPSTHPSAGLGYALTNAHMSNHPLYGPQVDPAPVQARVLRTREGTGPRLGSAVLGVGGFVTNDSVSSTYTPRNGGSGGNEADRAAAQLDPDLKGGNKIWVHPTAAYVDEKGRVQLQVTRAHAESIAVKTGNVESVVDSRRAMLGSGMGPVVLPAARSAAQPGTADNANFGPGLPDYRKMRDGQGTGRRSDRESAERIRDLYSSRDERR